MCVGPFDGRNDKLEDADASEDFKKWVEDNGGLDDRFGGSLKDARKAYARAKGGSGEELGTDKAEVTGGPADAPTFLGPRIETDRTGVRDLKSLPSIDPAPPEDSGSEGGSTGGGSGPSGPTPPTPPPTPPTPGPGSYGPGEGPSGPGGSTPPGGSSGEPSSPTIPRRRY